MDNSQLDVWLANQPWFFSKALKLFSHSFLCWFYRRQRHHYGNVRRQRAGGFYSVITSNLNPTVCSHLSHRSFGKLARSVCRIQKTEHEERVEPSNCQYGSCWPSGNDLRHTLVCILSLCGTSMVWRNLWQDSLQDDPFFFNDVDRSVSDHTYGYHIG